MRLLSLARQPGLDPDRGAHECHTRRRFAPLARARLPHTGVNAALWEVVVMRFSEFLKYLIVLLLLAIILVAVSR